MDWSVFIYVLLFSLEGPSDLTEVRKGSKIDPFELRLVFVGAVC